MFTNRYFGRYFADRYFPPAGAGSVVSPGASYIRRRARHPNLYDWRTLQFYVGACFPEPLPAVRPAMPPPPVLEPVPSPMERRRIAARQAAEDVERVARMLEDAGFEVIDG